MEDKTTTNVQVCFISVGLSVQLHHLRPESQWMQFCVWTFFQVLLNAGKLEGGRDSAHYSKDRLNIFIAELWGHMMNSWQLLDPCMMSCNRLSGMSYACKHLAKPL